VKDEKLMADFNAANQRAIQEMRGYSTWLKEQKLPKANENYAMAATNMCKCCRSRNDHRHARAIARRRRPGTHSQAAGVHGHRPQN